MHYQEEALNITNLLNLFKTLGFAQETTESPGCHKETPSLILPGGCALPPIFSAHSLHFGGSGSWEKQHCTPEPPSPHLSSSKGIQPAQG